MAYLKNWTDFFQICFMGTSWVAVSINNITTRASREMMSRKNFTIFYFNGVNVAKHWHVAGEVFAISDRLGLINTTSTRGVADLFAAIKTLLLTLELLPPGYMTGFQLF